MTFKNKTVYQIYPKSFKDTNGDGVGDIQGIIEKLPYLSNLGVDILWLNPFFPSPQKDNGYDISNYTAIDPLFGTMDDFQKLVSEANKYGMDLMLDMVFNHTSIEHEWFQKALTGDKKYQDFYFIKDAKENKLPTNWVSKFGGSAWAPFGNTGKYYLHLYDVTQADLNWRNPEVRKELYKVVNFWLEKGVKGFRFDVINVIGKDKELRDSENEVGKEMYTDKPIVHKYLKELNEVTFGRFQGTVTVGEMSSTNIANCILYSNPNEHELTMTFNFHHLKVDYEDGEKWTKIPFNFIELKRIFNEWQIEMEKGGGWNALFWNNHDQPRALSRFGNDSRYRVESAKMLAATIHLLRGTPYVYQGEEVGMLNPNYTKISDYKDIETHNAYKELLEKGISEERALEIIQEKSRDNSRTPMQWSGEAEAGFTIGSSWLKIPDNFKEINVERELKEGSIFNFYKRLISLRKESRIISEGSYQGLILDHPKVYGYARKLEDECLLVFNNFYGEPAKVRVPAEYSDIEFSYLMGNYEIRDFKIELELAPYETATFYSKIKMKEGL